MKFVFVKPVRQIVDDTKGKNERAQTKITMGAAVTAEGSELVIEKIQHQATHVGPVLEEILRQTQGSGQSHWGLNE